MYDESKRNTVIVWHDVKKDLPKVNENVFICVEHENMDYRIKIKTLDMVTIGYLSKRRPKIIWAIPDSNLTYQPDFRVLYWGRIDSPVHYISLSGYMNGMRSN